MLMPRIAPSSLAALLLSLAASPVSLAAPIAVYEAYLDGPSEAPPNASPGSGTGRVTIDLGASTMRVEASFTGLIGTVTAAHIHGPTATAGTGTAGVMTQTPTFGGFPAGVTSGSYDHTFDMTLASSFNASFVTAQGSPANAFATLVAALDAGTAYLNIHSTTWPGGEIRGFFSRVPDDTNVALCLAPALLALAGLRWRASRAA